MRRMIIEEQGRAPTGPLSFSDLCQPLPSPAALCATADDDGPPHHPTARHSSLGQVSTRQGPGNVNLNEH